jgi:hypothetical protein
MHAEPLVGLEKKKIKEERRRKKKKKRKTEINKIPSNEDDKERFHTNLLGLNSLGELGRES